MNTDRTGQITIATSIAPGKIEIQQAAIASWQMLGFRVLSVNTEIEINLLKSSFPQVHFVVAKRDASSSAGKPYIFLDDILRALKDSGSDVCGIVNSDIHIITSDALIDFIAEAARDSFVFGGRIDIMSLQDLHGEEYLGGFDIFFFDRSVIGQFPESEMCLGVPWWDYWAPLVMMLKGVTVKQLISPVAYHLLHDTNWNSKIYDEFGRKMVADVLDKNRFSELDNGLEEALNKSVSQHDLSAFSIFLLYYIKQKTDKLSFIDDDSIKNVHVLTINELIHQQEKLSYYETQFRQMWKLLTERENDRAEKTKIIIKCRLDLEASEQKITEMLNAYSWKITKPLRWLNDKLNRTKNIHNN